jgi:hypothetical protein
MTGVAKPHRVSYTTASVAPKQRWYFDGEPPMKILNGLASIILGVFAAHTGPLALAQNS